MPLPAAAAERARSADAFIDSIGVNTHFNYRNTPYYTRFDEVAGLLTAAGIRHIRDGAVMTDPPIVLSRLQDLARRRVKLLFVIKKTATPADLQYFAGRLSGSIEAFEAPNELNLSGDPDYADEARNSTRMLYETLKRPGGSTPIVGPSMTNPKAYQAVGDLSTFIDYGNMHNYEGGLHPGFPGWGPMASQSIAGYMRDASAVHASKPVMTTETGYCTSDKQWSTPAAINGRYEPRMFLEQYLHGVSRTYQYEFLDEGNPTSPFNHCGIVSNDLQPRPSYNALKGLIATLSDPGPSFETRSLGYSLSGDTANVDHALFEKRDGSMYLLLWIEKSGYDTHTQSFVTVPHQQVTLRLDQPVNGATIATFDDEGTLATRPFDLGRGSASIALSDHVTIVRLPPASR